MSWNHSQTLLESIYRPMSLYLFLKNITVKISDIQTIAPHFAE